MAADCISLVDFRARFPEFSQVLDSTILVFIGDACDLLSETAFGDICYPKAVAYYTAHNLSMSIANTEKVPETGAAPATPTGGIVGSGADGLSVSFANLAPTSEYEAYYSTTLYGKQYMILVEQCVDFSTLVEPSNGGCVYNTWR